MRGEDTAPELSSVFITSGLDLTLLCEQHSEDPSYSHEDEKSSIHKNCVANWYFGNIDDQCTSLSHKKRPKFEVISNFQENLSAIA